jgi:hypothetical protein
LASRTASSSSAKVWHRDHRAEDLRADELVAGAQAVDDRGRVEVPRPGGAAPAGDDRRVRGRALHQPGDVRELGGVVDRRDEQVVRAVLVAGQAHARGLLGQRRHEVAGDGLVDEHAGGGRAVLPGVEVAGDGDALGRGGEVGVGEHDARRLAAQLQVGAGDVRRGGRGHGLARPGAAGDRHHGGVGCAARSAPVDRSPQTTLNTPGGSRSANSSAISTVLAGVVSLGLRTIVLPAASAGANFQTAIIIG